LRRFREVAKLKPAGLIVNIVSSRYYILMPRKNTDNNNDDGQIADLILQIGRAAYSDCASAGLTQAQWIALRFFSRANRFSRNVSGFADFHGTTRGTASQTVKSLVQKGHLIRVRSQKDARSVRFDLTGEARAVLADDPLESLVKAVGKLSGSNQALTAACLREVMSTLAANRAGSVTGVCALCGHLKAGGKEGWSCRLMKEQLDSPELEELCVRFQPAA
jgi:DNA-binding MarR family transcriptional regulator